MNNKLYILLVAVVMITFPLFLGWVPSIGEFIPKVLVMLYVVFFATNLMHNKAFNWLLLFYLFVIIQSAALGYGFNSKTWFANFMDFALPIFLLQAAKKYDSDESERKLALFSVIFIFITVVLSIIVMINDPEALRYRQALVVGGEMEEARQYTIRGLASYSFAAMIMCMPAVLITIVKTTSNFSIRLFAIIGIVLSLVFMWMGQVTTTLLICICLAFISLFLRGNSSNSIFIGAAVLLIVVLIFGGPIIDAVTPYTEGTAMEEKFTNFSSNIHDGRDESEEGSVQGRMELTALTLKVFSEHPLFGDAQGYIGGHNYFIDRFALYGIIGVIPFFMMLYYLYVSAIGYLPPSKRGIYKLLFIGFIALGLLKNLSGMEYWLFMFCFYPFILKYSKRQERE